MAENSKIEWTDNTFNPWIGCTRVSPGCVHCYAEQLMDVRYQRAKWGPQGDRVKTSDANWKKPFQWNRQAEKEGRQIKVFCASLADVFEDNPQIAGWRIDLFEDIIGNTPWIAWQILTKRPERAYEFFENRPDLGFGNIWLGVSVEDQKRANERREIFKSIPIGIKFVSYEPAIGLVDWTGWGFIDWLICGGESGPDARPMHPQWARDSRDWAKASNVAYHFKQWGEFTPCACDDPGTGCLRIWPNGLHTELDKWEPGLNLQGSTGMHKVGKKAAGRFLDGQTWDEFPQVTNEPVC